MSRLSLPADFDPQAYLQINIDVKAAGIDPVRHYLSYGFKEGRQYKKMSPRLLPKLGEVAYNNDGLQSVHNHDFMQDPAFLSAYARGVKAAQTDYQWYWRVHIGLWAAAAAARLDGDFVECGVNRGFLSSAIMHSLDWSRAARTFYLLDTFKGLDERYLSSDEKMGGVVEKNLSAINSGFYTTNLSAVEANFSEWKNVKIIAGSIPDTLGEIESQKIAFMHLDLNCTQPEVAAIEFLWDRLVAGAFVLLDDYAYRGYQPQKDGMDAWALSRHIPIVSLPTGQGLIIKT